MNDSTGERIETGAPSLPINQYGLTKRELQVLRLIVGGNSSKECAAVLGISVRTVGTHREHIMAKMDVHGVAFLVRKALADGLG